ncbi:DUF934 domain-containing protein [Methyloprofundus sp.]|uniref:DUF934 domain-containing protein n=1 Tax=Methyloprofundus sp. TaxID=2020875 RepID=UPI003D11937C
MQLIKDKVLTRDDWAFVADDTTLKSDYNIVSLARWETERDALLQQGKHLGLRLESDSSIENITDDIANFQLIELFIPVFTDGRAFTHACLLRSRYGFTGDIRVSGDFMRDQVYYLNRVGISSFVLNDQDNAQQVIQSMDDFSVEYQESVA